MHTHVHVCRQLLCLLDRYPSLCVRIYLSIYLSISIYVRHILVFCSLLLLDHDHPPHIPRERRQQPALSLAPSPVVLFS